MVDYRRNRVLGGMFFFTVTLRNRRSDVLVRMAMHCESPGAWPGRAIRMKWSQP